MKALLKIFALALVATLSYSCENRFNEADFVTTLDSVCLIINGSPFMEYDQYYHQLAWNGGELQFRMMDDYANDYFIVNLSNMPSQMGEVVSAEIIYTTVDSIKEFSGSFNASKISYNSSGTLIWLWNESNRMGAIIQTLN
ncbi:MAG: hypothetical protein LUD72_10985 [Bacteroidales bacterium]|nr:hypothetical protein [Bacteroidales bacterium]